MFRVNLAHNKTDLISRRKNRITFVDFFCRELFHLRAPFLKYSGHLEVSNFWVNEKMDTEIVLCDPEGRVQW